MQLIIINKGKFNDVLAADFHVSDLFIRKMIGCFNTLWKNFSPHEAQNWSEDYSEFYSSKLDNNGELEMTQLSDNKWILNILPPLISESDLGYQFNKKRAETFTYDVKYFKPMARRN